MSQHQHVESHFEKPALVKDIVLGMSDGLTVPFALAAGLSGAVSSNSVIVTAGIAEIVAGSIAMGLGGYLAAKGEVEHFQSERAREVRETYEIPLEEEREVAAIFGGYGIAGETLDTLVKAIRKDRDRWVDFMMRFELGLERPDPKKARNSALTIALSYLVGGFVPISPYLVAPTTQTALLWSVSVTIIALFVFGYVKGKFTFTRPLRSAWQTLIVGSLAAGTAYWLAKTIS